MKQKCLAIKEKNFVYFLSLFTGKLKHLYKDLSVQIPLFC